MSSSEHNKSHRPVAEPPAPTLEGNSAIGFPRNLAEHHPHGRLRWLSYPLCLCTSNAVVQTRVCCLWTCGFVLAQDCTCVHSISFLYRRQVIDDSNLLPLALCSGLNNFLQFWLEFASTDNGFLVCWCVYRRWGWTLIQHGISLRTVQRYKTQTCNQW